MTSLLLILFSIALAAAFLALTRFERSRGRRVFAPQRERLDHEVTRALFIMEHVDFAAFARDNVRALALSISHDIAHLSLQIVRATERVLTQAVRHLRHRAISGEVAAPSVEMTRPFVKTMARFKRELQDTRPQMPEFGEQMS